MENSMTDNRQMAFPYSEDLGSLAVMQNPLDVDTGQAVIYVGDVLGGPLKGELGIVKRLYGTKALVDLGLSGTWNVPYYFLAKEFAA